MRTSFSLFLLIAATLAGSPENGAARAADAKGSDKSGPAPARQSTTPVTNQATAPPGKTPNQATAENIRQKIDSLLNGPPRSELQKLWAESFAAENIKKYDLAISAVEKVIQATNTGDNPYVQMRLGWLHYLNQDYQHAEAAYKMAVAAGPLAVTPRLGLLNCYLATNQINEAMEASSSILKIDPLNYRANKSLGDLFYIKEDYTHSAVHYQRLSTAFPDDLQMVSNLAWCYLKLGEKAAALQIFINVLAVQPDNVSAINGYTAAKPEGTHSTTSQPGDGTEKIVIRNPASADRTVRYTLNGQYPVSLEPGMEQTLDPGRTWTIRFEPGGEEQPVEQRLEAGHYELGWEKDRLKLSRQ